MAVANPNVVSRSRLPPSSPCPDPADNYTPAAPNAQPPSTTSLTSAVPSSRWRPCRQRQRRRARASWLRRPPRMCSDSGCVALPAHRAQQLRSTAQQLRSSGAQQLCLTNLDSAYLRFNPYVRPSYTQWRSCSPPPPPPSPLTHSFLSPSLLSAVPGSTPSRPAARAVPAAGCHG